MDDLNVDFEQCGKRVHSLWKHHVGKFIHYLRQSPPFADKVYVISLNSREYDAQFLLRSFLELRWAAQLVMDARKFLVILWRISTFQIQLTICQLV